MPVIYETGSVLGNWITACRANTPSPPPNPISKNCDILSFSPGLNSEAEGIGALDPLLPKQGKESFVHYNLSRHFRIRRSLR